MVSLRDIDRMIDRIEKRKLDQPLMVHYEKMRAFDEFINGKEIFNPDQNHLLKLIERYEELQYKWGIPRGEIRNVLL